MLNTGKLLSQEQNGADFLLIRKEFLPSETFAYFVKHDILLPCSQTLPMFPAVNYRNKEGVSSHTITFNIHSDIIVLSTSMFSKLSLSMR
jgi:hypothetical protein